MGNSSYCWENYVLKQRVGIVLAEAKKEKQNKPKRLRLIFCFFLFSFAISSYGQVSGQSRAKTVDKSESEVSFKSRWAFRTNAVDWILLLPNLTAEFDLFNSPFKHYTLSLGVKGNWNADQNYAPYIVYNLLDVRSEFRWYHRTSPRSYRRPDSLKINIFKRMKEDVFTWKRFHPRYWRAYYIGAYVDACNYSLKFGKEGRQGTAYGLGISGGFGIPLYAYKKNYLDLEFGASVGMVYTKYDVFQRDAESNCYPLVQNKQKDFHLVPYPVISELRVAFVYRFTSIKYKYSRVDEAKREARAQKKYLQSLAKDSINEMRLKMRQQRELQKDSIMQLKEKEKLQKEAMKDSLSQVRLLEKQAEESAKDSIRAAEKLQEKQSEKNKENKELNKQKTKKNKEENKEQNKEKNKKNKKTKKNKVAEGPIEGAIGGTIGGAIGGSTVTPKDPDSSSLQNLVDSMRNDSLPAKIEIVPIDKMPGRTKEKTDSLQTDTISVESTSPVDSIPTGNSVPADTTPADTISTDSIQATVFIEEREKTPLVSRHLILASVNACPQQSPIRTDLRVIWAMGLFVGIRKERSRK